MIDVKAVSSLKKIFLHDNFNGLTTLTALKCARGERVCFQLAMKNNHSRKVHAKFRICDSVARYTKMYSVGHVQVNVAAFEGVDDNYLSKKPGLYPDILYPITEDTPVVCGISNVESIWVTVDIPRSFKAGVHTLSVDVTNDKDGCVKTASFELEVKKTVIPKNDLIYTQWLHCDCIADYYGVPMMSKKHWRYIEQFIKTAARTGITMLLTPLFTPPLDTAIGGERPTMQLVGVTRECGRYSFDFSLLDKWVALCHKYGIEYFEMSHLFTQWGAGFCPKIIVNGKKEFGWNVASGSDSYRDFLTQLMPCLTAHLKALGIEDKCYFHISDEPHMGDGKPDFDNYKKAKELIAPYLDGFHLMDALSQPEFYDSGLVDTPVPFTGSIGPFLQKDIKERWCYYCASFEHNISDRMMAMPSARTRVLGTQLFMADMVGFLQWGFNFYYVNKSMYKIDPYHTTDADSAWPAGNAFSVYPSKDGGPALESIRTKVFYDGLQDRMLLKALAQRLGAEKAKQLVLDTANGHFYGFTEYPTHDSFLTELHDRVLDILG